MVVQCSGHSPRADFLIFALQSLNRIGHINWDSFLPSLLSGVSNAEISGTQSSQAVGSASSGLSQPSLLPSANAINNNLNVQISNPTSPLPTAHGIGPRAQSVNDMPSFVTSSPAKSDTAYSARGYSSAKNNIISSLRYLSCKIILFGLEFNLKPATHADIFSHMLNWLIHWDQKPLAIDENGTKFSRPNKDLIEWLHSCLDVIWLLVEEGKCRIPFYELLRSGLQFIDNIPDDEALFTAILEIHRRRDMMAMHMQMLDQHLHCPSFGTHRFILQTAPGATGEAVANFRYAPITYPSVLGETLHGEVTPFSLLLPFLCGLFPFSLCLFN